MKHVILQIAKYKSDVTTMIPPRGQYGGKSGDV